MAGRADPLLGNTDHKRNREHWRRNATVCHVCGVVLDLRVGSRARNALDVGHIVGRDQARLLGWTDRQINALANTRPECRRCNRAAGARYGNRKRRMRPVAPATADRRPVTSKPWG